MPDKIGLFGGTFDPVHKGHLAIARSFLDTDEISELWVLLTPYPPHKSGRDHTSYELRLKMLISAFNDIENVSVLTVERELPQPSYSIQTIRHLKSKFPDKEFYFCMGEDSLSGFHNWKEYHSILDEVKLLVASRPGADHSDTEPEILKRAIFTLLEPVDCASSDIRERIKNGENVSAELPEKVLDIIQRESLYK